MSKSARLKPIPVHMRSRPDCSVQYLTFDGSTYVIKLSRCHLRGKNIYTSLRHSNVTVECVYGGPCLVDQNGRVTGLDIRGKSVPVATVCGIRLYDKFSDMNCKAKCISLNAVITTYNPKVVSVAEAARRYGDEIVNSEFTSDVLRLLARMHNTYEFVHWDLHHHNQLIDLRDHTPRFLDFDYATMRYYEKSPILRSFCVEGFLSLLDSIHRGIGGESVPLDTDSRTLGYAYDRIMVLVSHHAFYRRSGRVYLPTNYPEQSIQKHHNMARTLVNKIGWRAHIVDTVGMTALDGPLKGHFKILFIAVLVIVMERYQYTPEQIEQYFREEKNHTTAGSGGRITS